MKRVIYWIDGAPLDNGAESVPGHLLPMEADSGERLSDVLRRNGVDIPFDCGGNGTCGKCRVLIRRLGKRRLVAAESIDSFPGEIGEGEFLENVLACQMPVEENLLVERGDRLSFRPPAMTTGGTILTESSLLSSSPACSGKKTAKGTTGRTGRYTAAVDLGTTTLAAALADSETGAVLQCGGMPNPQRKFGADLIARIGYAGQSAESLRELTAVLREGVSALIGRLAAAESIEPSRIERVTIAGNSVMETLFFGLDPSPLGRTPFEPPQMTFEPMPPPESGLPIHPKGTVELFPLLAGFVGGDLTAGLLARESAGKWEEAELLVDIGTNGEMLLITPETIYAASTAAGPAFEGGNIRFGSFAEPGAIERVVFPDEVRTIGDFPASGICGSGLVDAAAELLRLGLLQRSGRLLTAEEARGLPEADRLERFENQRSFRLSDQYVPEKIFLTQKDIRHLQLAVGAVRAGLEILLEQANLSLSAVSRLNLAGGFGRYLNRENAGRIGLLPAGLPLDRIDYLGNTSLAGAVLWGKIPGLGEQLRRYTERTVRVELEKSPGFTERFAEAMIFPYWGE